jgi:hypothetical protein
MSIRDTDSRLTEVQSADQHLGKNVGEATTNIDARSIASSGRSPATTEGTNDTSARCAEVVGLTDTSREPTGRRRNCDTC